MVLFFLEGDHRLDPFAENRFYEIIFFFQAEDGIRDADVTGVQTCALPIYSLWRKGGTATHRRRDSPSGPRQELSRSEGARLSARQEREWRPFGDAVSGQCAR